MLHTSPAVVLEGSQLHAERSAAVGTRLPLQRSRSQQPPDPGTATSNSAVQAPCSKLLVAPAHCVLSAFITSQESPPDEEVVCHDVRGVVSWCQHIHQGRQQGCMAGGRGGAASWRSGGWQGTIHTTITSHLPTGLALTLVDSGDGQVATNRALRVCRRGGRCRTASIQNLSFSQGVPSVKWVACQRQLRETREIGPTPNTQHLNISGPTTPPSSTPLTLRTHDLLPQLAPAAEASRHKAAHVECSVGCCCQEAAAAPYLPSSVDAAAAAYAASSQRLCAHHIDRAGIHHRAT